MINNEHLLRNENHAGVMVLANGQSANYGSIRVENGNAIYWTGKGLREAWPQSPDENQKKLAAELQEKSERELISSGHIAVTPLDQIQTVLR